MNARLFCACTGALGRTRAGEAGALILRAEEPGAVDAWQAYWAAVLTFRVRGTGGDGRGMDALCLKEAGSLTNALRL